MKTTFPSSKLGIISIGITILVGVAIAFSSGSTQAQSLTAFDFPLRDGAYKYGPILQYYGDPPVIVEDTRYGIKNPDLGSAIKCFGQPWNQLYHAGEDWYRFDKNTGQMLDTAGTEVKAVGDGKVVYKSDNIYPGYALIIEHTLSSPQNGHDQIYSVYMHLEQTFVISGQVINKGTPVGTVLFQPWSGTNPDPNRPSYDSHLHWEMRYFFDGSNIYDHAPNCNGLVGGRGYTYPQHPDDFPVGAPYVNPSAFIGYKVYLPLIRKDAAPTPPPPTPTSTPIPCIEGQNLVVNGGLEENIDSWPEWIQIRDPETGNALIDDVRSYEGSYSIWMGGQNNATEEIYQILNIPSAAKWAEVKFQFYVGTDETGNDDYDILYWDLKSDVTGWPLLQSPVTFTNRYTPQDSWRLQPIHIFHLDWLSEYRVRLSIRDTTDGALITNFFIDNVEFIIHCDPPPLKNYEDPFQSKLIEMTREVKRETE